jgi:beta-galactosidase GanA
VSAYWDWALLEGQQGNYTASGVFDIGLFLQVAKEAGVYIIAVSSCPNPLSILLKLKIVV